MTETGVIGLASVLLCSLTFGYTMWKGRSNRNGETLAQENARLRERVRNLEEENVQLMRKLFADSGRE